MSADGYGASGNLQFDSAASNQRPIFNGASKSTLPKAFAPQTPVSKNGSGNDGSKFAGQILEVEEEMVDSVKTYNNPTKSHERSLTQKDNKPLRILSRHQNPEDPSITIRLLLNSHISILDKFFLIFSKQLFVNISTLGQINAKTDSLASLDFIMTCISKNQERDLSRKQQRQARALQLQVAGAGWKLCRQLKHYKQASHRQRGMGTMTESQILCFTDRVFDLSHLPAGVPPEMSDMKLEENRLKSFSLDGRPAFSEQCKTEQKPEDLAANGFFYMQDGDRVKCAFCLGVLTNWKLGESIPEAHRLRFSTCPFLLGLDVGNKPIPRALDADDKSLKTAVACSEESQPAAAIEPAWSPGPAGRRHPHPDVECCSELACRPRPPVSAKVATAASRSGADANLELFSRSLHSPEIAARYHAMCHPTWRDPARREDSLARSSQAVPSDVLACAGFFLDAELRTACYWCGLQVLHWLGGDDPWIEHARWSPRCCHLLLERGHEFVLAARAACPPYQLQHLLRRQASTGPAGQLQTDSACPSDLSETPGSTMSLVTSSSQLIDYRIEPRCFKAREDFPPTLAVLQVGCDPDDAKTAQFLQLKGTGDDFQTYEMFLHGVLVQNQRRQRLRMSGREFYEQVQREQAQACSREPKALGEDDIDWRACKVCMDKVINVTLLDCKHLCCCSDCAKRLDACPLCRCPIRATMLVNMD